MNPFTRFLLGSGRKEDQALQTFVERWDALEALVIRVFRSKGAETADEAQYQQLRPWLKDNYPRWQERWQPYWQEALVGGLPVAQDPFQRLLTAEKAADFVGDWEAMQYLPAAREALNRYIQEVD
jgi:hypothetical protein